MAVRQREVFSDKNAGSWGSKIVAGMSWAVAVVMTERFISVLVDSPNGALVAALVIQAIFTFAESPIWRGRGQWYNFAVLGIDTVTNIGGLFFYILQLDQTDAWAAFNAGLGTTGGMSPLAALVVSMVLGILLAATPEFLWRQGGK